MTRPRISVIIPCLNHGPFIERAICSVLDQGYRNLQLLVVDAGSTDDTTDVLRLDEDLDWWASDGRYGLAGAINEALAKADGVVVGILPGDGLYLPGTLDAVAETMAGPAGPDWLVGDCLRIDSRDRMAGTLVAAAPASLLSFLMHDSGPLPTEASFIKRSLLQHHGRFDEQMTAGYDYEYWCRLLSAGLRPSVLPRSLAAAREHNESLDAAEMVEQGLEYITASRRYATQLTLPERCTLWRNCDYRERIYTLALAEARAPQARRFLFQQVLRRPWWVTNEALRHALFHGVTHALPADLARPAA